MTQHKFTVKLIGQAGSEVAAIEPPFDVVAVFQRKGRVPVKGTINGAHVSSIPTPTGRKIRFVTNRQLRFGEVARNTRSTAYNLTAGEIEINDQDASKSTGVLYPAAQFGIDSDGQISINLFQNPWQLTNIIDWKPKGKE